jgi:hypothetical protein
LPGNARGNAGHCEVEESSPTQSERSSCRDRSDEPAERVRDRISTEDREAGMIMSDQSSCNRRIITECHALRTRALASIAGDRYPCASWSRGHNLASVDTKVHEGAHTGRLQNDIGVVNERAENRNIIDGAEVETHALVSPVKPAEEGR